ncbi:uncharacterized protein TRAVEDRAFT_134700 [Trametes versicolor FP-101664 SS1]|uniref:uncharacterized protein n=1 Tax=Trametes versicolor (strain FP-101664) TaxID=717944 RepID=UPI0004624013|nr:uncharacterized protein TRAVEDRAFT_134700 [Trametes versicolor FP-101664 SS1]EIW53063.1 hypothetical protein TRAVEDRAFT_134700 [Trametes versicolor FP-101664 SS1]
MVTAVIFYEYAITFDSEVRLIWRRKITGASILFFNRYLLVLRNALTVVSFSPMSTPVPSPSFSHYAAFSTLRVYALSGRDWRFAAFVCLLMTGPIVGNVVRASAMEVFQRLLLSVKVELTHAAVVLLSRCTLIAGDAVVLAVTWWKTWSIKKVADAAHIGTSLVALLLRDGTLRTVALPKFGADSPAVLVLMQGPYTSDTC